MNFYLYCTTPMKYLALALFALGGTNLVAQEYAVNEQNPTLSSLNVDVGYASSEYSGAPVVGAFGEGVSGGTNAENEESERFTESTPELKELQKELKELKAEFKAEQEKNKKKDNASDPFNVKFGGSLALDATFVSQNDESRSMFGKTDNVFEVRDVRFVAKGTGHGNLQFAAGVGFQESIKLYDNFVRFKDTEYLGDVTIGHFYVESGMESVEPSFDPVFISTDEGSSFFRMNRRFGIASALYNEKKSARAFFGVFAAPAVNTWPNRTENNDPGVILNTRLTTAPILVENEKGGASEVLHFGGSFYWLGPTDDAATLNLKSRGLAWSGSNPYFINGTVSLKDRSYSVSQAEVAYQHEGFATTAEGYVMSITNGGGNAYGTTVTARWSLTPGCVRTYNKGDARFSSMSMPDEVVFVNYKQRAVGQGWGALEAVAKWEYLETSHVNFTSSNPSTGTVNRSVVGANWWWNSQTTLAIDWEHAFANVQKGNKSGKGQIDTLVLQTGIKF